MCADLVLTSSPGNDTSEPIEDGFITASHVKSRKLGIPLVLCAPDDDFRKTGPKELHAENLRIASCLTRAICNFPCLFLIKQIMEFSFFIFVRFVYLCLLLIRVAFFLPDYTT